MAEDQPQGPLPGRVPWRPLAVAVLVFTAISAGIVLHFAYTYRPFLLLHLVAAYLVLVALLWIYTVAYETRHRWLRLHVWLMILLFSAVLCFVYLDDAPARLIGRGAEIQVRPPAPRLYWATALIVLNALLLTLHLVWLGRGKRRIGRSRPGSEMTPMT
ncbi:MAG: hypothetical protein JW797_00615 [Bradymonadales bacterium]|nr:hypothetical protein [Bradymonadales bacterium]